MWTPDYTKLMQWNFIIIDNKDLVMRNLLQFRLPCIISYNHVLHVVCSAKFMDYDKFSTEIYRQCFRTLVSVFCYRCYNLVRDVWFSLTCAVLSISPIHVVTVAAIDTVFVFTGGVCVTFQWVGVELLGVLITHHANCTALGNQCLSCLCKRK